MTEPDILEKISERTHILAPAAVLVGAAALGLLRGPGAAVLALAAGALLAGISALWSSLRVLAGDAPISLHEAIDLGAPTELQERKQAILLALSDLKREHALGKLSDDDFKDMSARYRAQAKQLLREMDDDLAPARKKAEALLAARLEGKPEEEEEEPPAKKKKAAGSARPGKAARAGKAASDEEAARPARAAKASKPASDEEAEEERDQADEKAEEERDEADEKAEEERDEADDEKAEEERDQAEKAGGKK